MCGRSRNSWSGAGMIDRGNGMGMNFVRCAMKFRIFATYNILKLEGETMVFTDRLQSHNRLSLPRRIHTSRISLATSFLVLLPLAARALQLSGGTQAPVSVEPGPIAPHLQVRKASTAVSTSCDTSQQRGTNGRAFAQPTIIP